MHVHKTQIRNCRGTNGNGISVTNSSGIVELFVDTSYITGNGNSTTTGGILVRPTATGSAVVMINATKIEDNAIGIRIDSSATTGTIRGTVRDSTVAGSTNNGIAAVSGAANVANLLLDHASIVGNLNGLVVNGASASLVATHTVVTANGTGLLVNGSGQLISYQTNAVNNNTTNGAFTGTLTPN